MFRPIPMYENNAIQLHFLVQLFWYLSQWSGSIWSIFYTRLYSKDIHCELQNQEMISEGDLACAMDQSNKIREMQDKISNLRAQVPIFIEFIYNLCISPARPE